MEKIIGYVSQSGYLYCVRCAAEREFTVREASPVYERSAPRNHESCDACETPLIQTNPVYHLLGE